MQNPPQPPSRGFGRPRALAGVLAAVAVLFILVVQWVVREQETPAVHRTTPAAEPARAGSPQLPAPDTAVPAPLVTDVAPKPGGLPAALAAKKEKPPEPATVVPVIVVDLDGQPVPQARVTVRHGSGRSDELFTDGIGRVTLQLAPHDGLHAQKDGVGQTSDFPFAFLQRTRSPEADVVLRLLPDAVVDGLVLRADGSPAADTTVGWQGSPQDATVLVGERTPTGRVQTTQDGRFRLALRHQPEYAVWAELGGGLVVSEHFAIPIGGHADVTLHLPGDWWIAGQVFSADGSPAAKATVLVLHREGLKDAWADLSREQPPTTRRTATTGDDGRFNVRVTRLQPYAVFATQAGPTPSDPVLVTLDAQNPTATVVLHMATPASITGRVVTPQGAPVPGLLITAPPVAPPLATRFRSPMDGMTTTDSDGRFTIRNLHPLAIVDVHVQPGGGEIVEGMEVVAERVAAGTTGLQIVATLDVPSSRTGALLALVRSAVTGRAPGAITWRVLPEGTNGPNPPLREAADPEGWLRVDKLVAGEHYTLIVSAEGHAAVDVHGLVASEQPVAVNVELPALAELDVEAVDRDGAPLAYVEVSLERSYDTIGFRPHKPRTTDALGRVHFPQLDPGSFRVAFTYRGVVTEQVLDVGPGEARFLRLMAQAGS